MDALRSVTFETTSPHETEALAARLAPGFRAGDTVLMEGPVGAGKSLFVRAVIHALGIAEDVPSPTFTLVQTYEAPDFEIWHADLYRLGGPDDVIELGLEEAFAQALCFIEWPDRLGLLTPVQAMRLILEPLGENHRRLTLAGPSHRIDRLLAR